MTFAFRTTTTAPTLATGFTNVETASGSGNSFRVGCQKSAGGTVTSGTWTNATMVASVSYSGTNIAYGTTANCSTIGVGASTNTAATGSVTMSYGGITLNVTNGSSWVIGFGGDVALSTCNPSGMTNVGTSGSGPETTLNDTNAGVSSWSTTTCSVTSSSWRTAVVEVMANPCYNTTIGGGWTCTQGSGTAGSGSSVASVAAPQFTVALTNPSILVVACQSNQANGATSNARESFGVPTDTTGHTFLDVQVGMTWWNSQAISEEVFYVENTSTTANDTITCNTGTGGNADFFSVVAFELTGGATSGPIDVGAKYYNPEQTGGAVAANNVSLTAQTPTVSGDLVLAFFGMSGGPGTPGTVPNAFTQISGIGGIVEYFYQSSAASIGPTAEDGTGSDAYGGIWIALTPSGTAAQPTNNYRNDTSITADGTSLGHNFTLVHMQANTSDSLPVLTDSQIISKNPTIGDYQICQNQFFPVSSLSLSCADSLGNVAAGHVTTTAPHTVTFVDGVPFNLLGNSAESGGTNTWASQTITLGSAGALTISAIASQTSLTVTQTISTNSTPQTYVGPSWSCTDVGDGAAISMNTCRAKVTNTGTDTLTVTATIAAANFDLGSTYIELGYTGGTVVGEDTGACPAAGCAQQDLTSNASTGIVSESLTLANAGELTLFSGDGVVGPASITSGSTSGIIGVTGSGTATTLTNPYCQLSVAFCINEIQSAFLSFVSSGSNTVNGMTDATKGEQYSTQAFAFIGQTTNTCADFITYLGMGCK